MFLNARTAAARLRNDIRLGRKQSRLTFPVHLVCESCNYSLDGDSYVEVVNCPEYDSDSNADGWVRYNENTRSTLGYLARAKG